jgi:hypothetical protein
MHVLYSIIQIQLTNTYYIWSMLVPMCLKSDNMHVLLAGIHNYIYCTVDHCLEFEYPRDLDILYCTSKNGLKGQSHEIFRALLWQSSIDQAQVRGRYWFLKFSVAPPILC